MIAKDSARHGRTHSENPRIITERVPYPPSLNQIYGRSRVGKVYLKKVARDYREHIYYLFLQKKLVEAFSHQRLHIDIHQVPCDARLRDNDNILKCFYDSLQYSTLIKNDNQLEQTFIKRYAPHDTGFLQFTLRELNDDEKQRAEKFI